jgi:hypothetical protein
LGYQKTTTKLGSYHEDQVFLDGEAANEQVILVHEPRQTVHVITSWTPVHPYVAVSNHTGWE